LESRKAGWPTGLEPATTRTTIWGSTIELRPPSFSNCLAYANKWNHGLGLVDAMLNVSIRKWSKSAMRRPAFKVRPYRHSKTHKFTLDLRAFGKGRKFFKTRADAEAEAMRQRTLLERYSREAVGLSQREMSEVMAARSKVSEYGKTLSDAVEFYVDHLERIRRCKISVAQLAEEVLETKRKDGRSAKYLAMLRLYFKRFCQDFGNRLIADITIEELDAWLRDLPGSPKTRADYRANIGVLFGHAAGRRMIDFNPVTFTAKPKLIDKAPEIFKVDELRALLEAAAAHEPDVLPMLAVGAFAGLRDAEIKRLDWSEVDLARDHIEVTAAKAKSARRRIVPILPNLKAWLRPYSGTKGRLAPVGARKKLVRARKAADLARWPQNGLRHSFASYRLAAIHDAPRVASELGHTNPQMLYGTYRELVLPQEAERYWKIAPAAENENVVAFSAVS
jgi:integrase